VTRKIPEEAAKVRTPGSTVATVLAALPLVVGLVSIAPPAAAGSGAAVERATCSEIRLPVAMTQGGPATATYAGTLCTPSRGPRADAVDVLVHGGMYNREYWNWPVDPQIHSYVQRTVDAGRAAFFYDRFGVGQSSRPARGSDADFDADVNGLHQVIQWLRPSYDEVNVVGHSLGSVIAIDEAGRWNDADRLVVTGLTHGHGLGFLTLPAAIWPAALDPLFIGDIGLLDGGYVTTRPGERARLFYSAAADPDVIAYDEAHKDVMTLAQTRQAIVALTLLPPLNRSTRVTRPVLLVNGVLDAPFCNVDVPCTSDAVLATREGPYYAGAPSFTARVVAGTGHDLPLHPSADVSFGVIDGWLAATPPGS
jgi:alpha-beta hydrolase superfamily lysophospholipase